MEWYVLRLGKVEGPFDTNAVDSLIDNGSLNAGDMFCKKGETLWQSFENWSKEDITNQVSPSKPWVVLKKEFKDGKSFYLQQGPYSTEEVVKKTQAGDVKYSDHVWKNGLDRWTPLHEIDDFFVRQHNFERPPAYSATDLFMLKQESIIEESKKNSDSDNGFDFSSITQQVSSTSLHQLDFNNEALSQEEPAAHLDQTRFKPLLVGAKKVWGGIDSTWKRVVENITPVQTSQPDVSKKSAEQTPKENVSKDRSSGLTSKLSISKPKDEMEWLPWVLGVILVSMVGMGLFWGFSQVDNSPQQAKAESYMDWGAQKPQVKRKPAQKKSSKAKSASKSTKRVSKRSKK